ncbi:MAG: DUF2061 domain-containing protein [Pseudomonadota bacterium]
MDTAKRTWVKAGLWSLIGFLVMTAVGYVATGSLGAGGGMAIVNTGLGLVTYAIYERIWARINWGRV